MYTCRIEPTTHKTLGYALSYPNRILNITIQDTYLLYLLKLYIEWIRLYVHMHLCDANTCTCTYVCTYVCTCIKLCSGRVYDIHLHAYVHTFIHMYVCTVYTHVDDDVISQNKLNKDSYTCAYVFDVFFSTKSSIRYHFITWMK